jgi:hypothetical protein
MKRDRFPGLRSFEQDDAEIFFGRDTEINQLAKLIMVNRINVVFGPSGVGKSSLLNTVFLKEKELSYFLPIRIRLNQNYLNQDDVAKGEEEFLSPAEIVYKSIEANLKQLDVIYRKEDIIYDGNQSKIWEYIKLADSKLKEKFPNRDIVLIFDQFEEFFSCTNDVETDFINQLAEITHELSPKRILDWIGNLNDTDRIPVIEWYKQPSMRILFAIRSDKLSLMDRMDNSIPNILSNRFQINFFDSENAKLAINGPALLPYKNELSLHNESEISKIKSDSNSLSKYVIPQSEIDFNSFYTPPIIISKKIIDLIINELSNKSDEIHASFLQIVCYYIEQKVKSLNIKTMQTPFVFSESEFLHEINITNILDQFYEDQLAKIGNIRKQEMARRVIEDDLISDGKRASLLESQLINKLGGDKSLIDRLLSARIIRSENTPRGVTFELSHDKLVEPVETSKKIRLQKERLDQETKERDDALIKEAKERDGEIAKQKELLKITSALKDKAENQRLIAIEERKRAEAATELAQRSEQLAIVAKRKAEKRRIIANTLLFICILLFAFSLYSLIKLYKKANEEILTRAESNYAQNNHYNAFRNWENYLNDRYLINRKDSIQTLLSDKFFFDISGGDNIQQFQQNSFLVHQFAGSFFVWEFDPYFSKLNAFKFEDKKGNPQTAANTLVSPDKRYIAYRNIKDSMIYVYDQTDKVINKITGSQIDFVAKQGNKKLSNITDFKMDFLLNTRFISFINSGGNLSLFDLTLHKTLPLEIIKRKETFSSRDLKKICMVSGDNKMMALKRPANDTLKLYQLNGFKRPVKSATFGSVDNVFSIADKNKLLIRFKNKTLAIMSFHGKNCDIILSDVTDIIVSPDGSKALILKGNKDLFVYDLVHKSRIESKKLLRRFWEGEKTIRLNDIVRWIGNTNKFSFRNRKGIVFVIDLSDVSSHFLCDGLKSQNTLKTSENFNYVFSNDGSRGMYLNKNGVLKVIDINSSTIIYSEAVSKNSDLIFSLSYNLENIIALSDDGKNVAIIKNFDTNQNELIILSLEDKKILYRSTSVKYIGKFFTNKFIHLIYDNNNAGGIIFLNQKERNIHYYSNLYPTKIEKIFLK